MQKETKEMLWACGLSFLAGIITTITIFGICHCFCKGMYDVKPKRPQIHQVYNPPRHNPMPMQQERKDMPRKVVPSK